MENLEKITSQKIRELKNTLPVLIMEKHFELKPKLKAQYTERHKKLYLEDSQFHLSYLAESIAADEPALFTEYLSWAKIFFSTLPVDQNDIVMNLQLIRDALGISLEKESAQVAVKFMNAGIEIFSRQVDVPASFILSTNPLNISANKYLSFLIDGNKKSAQDLIMEAVQTGTSVKDIYLNIFQITQKETGRLWQLGKITVAQEHFITAATQLIMSQLYPYLFTSVIKKK